MLKPSPRNLCYTSCAPTKSYIRFFTWYQLRLCCHYRTLLLISSSIKLYCFPWIIKKVNSNNLLTARQGDHCPIFHSWCVCVTRSALCMHISSLPCAFALLIVHLIAQVSALPVQLLCSYYSHCFAYSDFVPGCFRGFGTSSLPLYPISLNYPNATP